MTETSHGRQLNLSERPVDISETLRFMPYDGRPAEIGDPDLRIGGVAGLVEIRPATLRDVTWIATYMRDQDRREINAVMEATDTAIGYSMFSQSQGLCWTAWLKGQPVCAFGVVRLYPGMGSCWAFGTRKMRRVIPAVTKFVLRTLRRKVLVERFRRLEVRTSVDHDLSHAWLEKLGFEREGIARDYGRDGLDFVTYSVTRASDARRREREKQRWKMRTAIDVALERGLVADPRPGAGCDLGLGYLITLSEKDWLFVPERLLGSTGSDKRSLLERELAAFNDHGAS